MNKLKPIAARTKARKLDNYIDEYWRLFGSIRHEIKNVLEIGVAQGFALAMWKEFFPNAMFYGLDKKPHLKEMHECERVEMFTGSQGDPAILNKIKKLGCIFDIIFDDGSHQVKHQIFTANQLFPLVKPGGVYIIEDLHTSYMPGYGGKMGTTTCVEWLKSMLDEVNHQWHIHDPNRPQKKENQWNENLRGMYVCDSLVFLFKQ